MSVTQWIIVGMVAFLVIDLIVCLRWIKRAKAARDAGEPPPRPPWSLRL